MSAMAELVLGSDSLEVALLPELGARIHRIRAFGTDILRTPEDPATHRADPFFWGAYPMAPWCNRVRPGAIRIAGRTVDLEPNFTDGTAIHGQAATRPWRMHADGSLHFVGGGANDGWPWSYEVVAMAAIDGSDLTLDYVLINRSDGSMPGGIGLHPWFRRPVQLGLPAAAVYPANAGSAPDPEPVGGAHDLRIRRFPAFGLDGTWTDLAAPRFELVWPNAGIAATVEMASARQLIAVATPAHVDAIAVEPQSHGPDGLRRLANDEPDALTLMSPGATLGLRLRLHFEHAGTRH
jgi:aldose 1-epimerase